MKIFLVSTALMRYLISNKPIVKAKLSSRSTFVLSDEILYFDITHNRVSICIPNVGNFI